jgi:hypothetical protein
MEDTVDREGKVYGVLWHNGCRTQMSYPLLSSEGTIILWMREIEGCTSDMVDEAIRFLNPVHLHKLPCPTYIWNFEPRDTFTWRLIWQHYMCQMLELPDVCYVEKFIASMFFPDHVAALVEEFFHKPEDGTELRGWDSILLVG